MLINVFSPIKSKYCDVQESGDASSSLKDEAAAEAGAAASPNSSAPAAVVGGVEFGPDTDALFSEVFR